MKEILIRSLSGLFYVVLLLLCINYEPALLVLFGIFGLICIAEFNKLIELKSKVPFAIFILGYGFFATWLYKFHSTADIDKLVQIIIVIGVFVQLFLIKDLFSEKGIPLFVTKRFILTTFYLSSGFVFLVLIPYFYRNYNPNILLGAFLLIWTNDSFAYLVGKNFGKQKLFEKISPKKTVEGFLGGLFFASLASYFIAKYLNTLNFTQWLILSIIISVFGTLGDLIESKFKRQAGVKDSGIIMPGHGGLMDRLDSIIFAAPFIYLFLRMLRYVS